jgi:hypothetical protein
MWKLKPEGDGATRAVNALKMKARLESCRNLASDGSAR